MNIYLGIYGVLLINESHVANYADEFLQVLLTKRPNSTYWLTIQNRKDHSQAEEVLAQHLRPETVTLLGGIKESKWSELKTDAIDFEQDFLWFGDNLWPDELKVLEKHEAAEQFIMVNLDKNPDMLQELTEVILSTAA